MFTKQQLVIISLVIPNIQSVISFNSPENTHSIFDLRNKMPKPELLHQVGLFMRSIMNQSVSPCDDFYKYACGNWPPIDIQGIPTFGHPLSFRLTMQHAMHGLAVDYLESETKFSKESDTKSAEEKAKLFYKSCMTTKQDVKTGLKLLLQEEEQLFRRLKFTGKYDWLEVNFMSPYGINPLLPLIIKEKLSASGQYEITLDLPQPYLTTYFHSSPPKNKFLRRVRINETDIKQILLFERRLTHTAKERQLTERATLREFLLHHNSDLINWNLVFQKVFANKTQGIWYVNNYIANIDQLHTFLNNTPVITLRNYVKLCTIVKFYKMWTKRSMLHGNLQSHCRYLTETYFRYALMPWFRENFFDPHHHRAVSRMAEYIKQHFGNSIKNYNWLSNETKLNVKQKLQDMDVIVGFTKEVISKTFRAQRYGELCITANWFKNLQHLEAHFTRLLFQSVHQKLHPTMLSPFAVNSFYSNILNIVFISMGFAQIPLYHQDLPVALKFSGIGTTIAHEIAHAFDSNSYLHEFDTKDQRYSNKLWLSDRSLKDFRKRRLCLKHQYEDFKYQDKTIDDSALSLTENVADNAMLHLSYDAYKSWSGSEKGCDKPLGDLDFNSDQLFFIKFAQLFCSADVVLEGNQHEETTAKPTKHVYDEFRVMVPLQNMPAFAKLFKCKLGSPMNPVHKCRLW